MGINKMKGKLDVSNEDSHIPLHFLIIKYAAQFTPLGDGNGSVYTGGGSDTVATMFLSPSRFCRIPGGTVPLGGPHPCAERLLSVQVAFLADVTSPSAHGLSLPWPTFSHPDVLSQGRPACPFTRLPGNKLGGRFSFWRRERRVQEGRASVPLQGTELG